MNHDFSKFAPLKPKLIEIVDHMLANDIAKLMSQIPMEDAAQPQTSALVKGGIFTGHQDKSTPFGFKNFEGVEAGEEEEESNKHILISFDYYWTAGNNVVLM